MTDRRKGGVRRAARRTALACDLVLFFASLIAIAVVTGYFAHRPGLRLRFDATRTRSYSLSEQTQRLLGELEGQWTIALLLPERDVRASTLQQVSEVLRRFDEASERVSIVRIDPTDPASLTDYESLLARLRALEGDRIRTYDDALDDGAATFGELRLFAQQQAGQLNQLLEYFDADDPVARDVQQVLSVLVLLSEEGDRTLSAVEQARQSADARPIPDYESARSILAAALSNYADQLYGMARIYDGWRAGEGVNAVLARFSAGVRDEYESTSRELAAAADRLRRLPELDISTLGRRLQEGEAAIVIGPDRAAVIASDQLFPKMNLRPIGEDAVAFDRRFRGEQVIAAAIRSLRVERMPLVVFVHAEPQSLLRENQRRADVVGIASLLRASRFDVEGWSVGTTDRPTPRRGQPVVWVVIPPMSRQGLEPDADEQRLIQTAKRLIADGASVMLNVNPSLMPAYQLADPWRALATPFGLFPETGEVILEAVQLGSDRWQYDLGQAVQQFAADHPVCDAANGQQAYFVLPVPIETADVMPDGVRITPVASVRPQRLRWLESNWAGKLNLGEVTEIEPGDPLEGPTPILVAAERGAAGSAGSQRFILVGSGGWMLSYVADAVTPLGGGRRALTNPGNHELMLASIAWLAGMDDLIAPSPVSRQVARLDGIDEATAIKWGLITVLGAPLGVLLLGVFVWMYRRL